MARNLAAQAQEIVRRLDTLQDAMKDVPGWPQIQAAAEGVRMQALIVAALERLDATLERTYKYGPGQAG